MRGRQVVARLGVVGLREPRGQVEPVDRARDAAGEDVGIDDRDAVLRRVDRRAQPVAAEQPHIATGEGRVDRRDGRACAVDTLIREVITPLSWRACRKFLRGRVPDPAVAIEEVVQLVVHAVVRSLARFGSRDGSFDAFGYGIARHKVADAFRGAARNRSVPVADVPERTDHSAEPERAALRSVRAALARRLIATLSPRWV